MRRSPNHLRGRGSGGTNWRAGRGFAAAGGAGGGGGGGYARSPMSLIVAISRMKPISTTQARSLMVRYFSHTSRVYRRGPRVAASNPHQA